LQGLRDFPVKVYLFGSHATGRAARASDIDIAVFPEGPLPEGVLADIREQLGESSIIYTVDLVNLATAEEELRARVLKEGLEWHA
jgi:predicted nucleotidyltransferase